MFLGILINIIFYGIYSLWSKMFLEDHHLLLISWRAPGSFVKES